MTTEKEPYRIPLRDEADLSWYFGPGAACFEKSTFGIALERAVQFGQCAEPCGTCAGLGFVELTAEQMVARAALFERLAIERKDDEATSATRSDDEVARLRQKRDAEHLAICAEADCPDCIGRKVTTMRLKRRRGDARKTTMRCPACHGSRSSRNGPCGTCAATGYIVPVTANPKPAGRESEGWCPDDESLIRYARVSKRLDRLTEAAFEALKLFYGDRGCRWAGSIQGRLLALYPLTAVGGKLAARGITRAMRDALGELGVRLDEAIWNECEAQRAKPDENRKRSLEKARAQAEDILQAAANEWRDAAPKKPKPPTVLKHWTEQLSAPLDPEHLEQIWSWENEPPEEACAGMARVPETGMTPRPSESDFAGIGEVA